MGDPETQKTTKATMRPITTAKLHKPTADRRNRNGMCHHLIT